MTSLSQSNLGFTKTVKTEKVRRSWSDFQKESAKKRKGSPRQCVS